MSETLADRSMDTVYEDMKQEELAVVDQLFRREWRAGGYINFGQGETLSLTVSGPLEAIGPFVVSHTYTGLKEVPLSSAIVEASFQDRYVIAREQRAANEQPVSVAIVKTSFDLSEEHENYEQELELIQSYKAGTLEGPLGPFQDPELAKQAFEEKQRNLRRRREELKRQQEETIPGQYGTATEQLFVANQLKRVLQQALPAQQVAQAQAEHDARQRGR